MSRLPRRAAGLLLALSSLATTAACVQTRPSRADVSIPSPTAGRTTSPSAAATRDVTPPDAIVDRYLRRRLVERDAAAAKLLQCRDPNLTQLDGYVADLTDRETRFGVTIDSRWGSMTIATGPTGEATVTLDLTRSVPDGSASTTNSWVFTLIDEDGWRVCGARSD